MAAFTLLCWALIFTLAVYVARILSIPVRAGFIVLIMPIVTLVELIPFSIAGLGTRDATVDLLLLGGGRGECGSRRILDRVRADRHLSHRAHRLRSLAPTSDPLARQDAS